MADRRLPADLSLERSVLAEIAEPLHHVRGLSDVTPGDFYDQRHARIVGRLRGVFKSADDERYVADDRDYVDDCVRFAWPLLEGGIERFFALAARRRRALLLTDELSTLLEAR
jgi:hypothetical protein